MAKPDYEKFCDEVFKVDKDIRFVGIFDRRFHLLRMRKGVQSLLTSEETQNSILDTVSRWRTRQGLAKKLGEPVYALAEYKKVKRITIPIHDDGLILVSTELSAKHEIIMKKIIELRNKYLSE